MAVNIRTLSCYIIFPNQGRSRMSNLTFGVTRGRIWHSIAKHNIFFNAMNYLCSLSWLQQIYFLLCAFSQFQEYLHGKGTAAHARHMVRHYLKQLTRLQFPAQLLAWRVVLKNLEF